jgi:hypothetical protein
LEGVNRTFSGKYIRRGFKRLGRIVIPRGLDRNLPVSGDESKAWTTEDTEVHGGKSFDLPLFCQVRAYDTVPCD